VSRVVVALCLLTARAFADASTAIPVERFVPGLGPSALLAGEGAGTTPFAHVTAALSLSWIDNPLRLSSGSGVISRPVTGMLTADASLEAGAWKRISVAVGAPVVLYARGSRLQGTGAGDESALGYPTGGDLRLRAKASFVGDPAKNGFHLAFLLQLTVPLDGQSQFAASAGVTGEPRLIADYRWNRLLVVAMLGVHFQPERTLFRTTFGDEITWLAGASVRAWERGRFRLDALLEAGGFAGTSDGTRPAELRGGLRTGWGDCTVDLAAGGGLTHDAASPAWRFVAVVRHAFDVAR